MSEFSFNQFFCFFKLLFDKILQRDNFLLIRIANDQIKDGQKLMQLQIFKLINQKLLGVQKIKF